MLKQHLEKLISFHTIARNGTMLKTSKVMGISQPALTKAIQSLEEALGLKLFKRHQRGMDLTEAGKELFVFCEKLFSELPNVEQKLKSPGQMSGVLRIGSYETLGISFWPQALKRIYQTYPHLQLKIITESPNTLWKKLDDGILDIIVDAEPPAQEKYFSKIIYTDKFGIYVKPGAHFPEDEPLLFSFVQRAFDRNGKTIEDHLRNHKIEHNLLYDFDSFTLVRAVTLEGLAVGVLPSASVASDIKKGALQELTIKGLSFFGEHRICATSLEERRKDLQISAVVKIIKDIF